MISNKDIYQRKKIVATIIMILVLMVSVTGATYAFFVITAPTNTAIKGVSATANLSLNIERIIPDATAWNNSSKIIIPQLDSELESVAVTKLCLDEYDNVLCQIYKMTLTNTGSSAVRVDGTITFSGTSNMPNLKFKSYNSDSVVSNNDLVSSFETVSSVSIVNDTINIIEEDLWLNISDNSKTDDTHYYYLVVWVSETGSTQTDNGTYKGTVTFNAVDGTSGVTSTFT